MDTVKTKTHQATRQLSELIAELKNLNVEISVEESKRPTLSSEDVDALRKSLIRLVQVSSRVRAAQSPSLINEMDRYISNPADYGWKRMVFAAKVVRDRIAEAQDAFQRVDNIYIFEKSHQQFVATFNARSSYLDMIIGVGKPIDPKLFRTYRDAYSKLIATLESLIENLRTYGREFVNSGSEAGTTRKTLVVAPRPDLRGRTLLIISILTAAASVLFALFGVWLVALGSAALGSQIKLFGQSIKTQSVGVACVFIGGVTLVIILRRVMKSLDRSDLSH